MALVAVLGASPCALAGRPEARATPAPSPLEVTAGEHDAPVTLIGYIDLTEATSRAALGVFVRLMAAADQEHAHVALRPRLDLRRTGTLRAARLAVALPDPTARRRWLAEVAGGTDVQAAPGRLGFGRAALCERGDAPPVDRWLVEELAEQARLEVGGEDVVFLNGARLEPVPAEQDLLFAARREVAAARAGRDRPFTQAEAIGPPALGVLPVPGSPPGPGPSVGERGGRACHLVTFVDARDPHSRRLARHVSGFLRHSPLAAGCTLRVAAFPRDRHAEAYGLAALAHCAQALAAPVDVLDAVFGGLSEGADVDAPYLCPALALPAEGCARLVTCASSPEAAEAVLAERAAARAAGVRAPPALFLGGRRLLSLDRGLSRPFLEDVIVGYHLRTWELPAGSRLEDVDPRPATPGSDRRSP